MATIVLNLLKDFSQMRNVKLKMSYGRHIAKHVKEIGCGIFYVIIAIFSRSKLGKITENLKRDRHRTRN
jgi:hypothetical protein